MEGGSVSPRLANLGAIFRGALGQGFPLQARVGPGICSQDRREMIPTPPIWIVAGCDTRSQIIGLGPSPPVWHTGFEKGCGGKNIGFGV